MNNYNFIGAIFAGFGITILLLLVFVIGAWFLGCWLMRKMLQKIGIETTAIMYVPFANMWTMVSKLDCFGTFKLFSADIPSQYVKIGAAFYPLAVMIPIVGPLVAVVVGIVSLIAVDTRVWDVADGRHDGDSAVMGLLSALIGIVYVVKLISILIGNSRCTIDQFRASGENFSAAVQQSKQPKERQVYDPNQQRMVTTTETPSEQPQYKRVSRGGQMQPTQQFTSVQPTQPIQPALSQTPPPYQPTLQARQFQQVPQQPQPVVKQAQSMQPAYQTTSQFRQMQPPYQPTPQFSQASTIQPIQQSGVQLDKPVAKQSPVQPMQTQPVTKRSPVQYAPTGSIDDSIL